MTYLPRCLQSFIIIITVTFGCKKWLPVSNGGPQLYIFKCRTYTYISNKWIVTLAAALITSRWASRAPGCNKDACASFGVWITSWCVLPDASPKARYVYRSSFSRRPPSAKLHTQAITISYWHSLLHVRTGFLLMIKFTKIEIKNKTIKQTCTVHTTEKVPSFESYWGRRSVIQHEPHCTHNTLYTFYTNKTDEIVVVVCRCFRF